MMSMGEVCTQRLPFWQHARGARQKPLDIFEPGRVRADGSKLGLNHVVTPA